MNRVLAGWSPYCFSSQVKWKLVQAAQQAGFTGLLPRVEQIAPADARGINWQAVGWKGSTPPVPAIYIGTPGPRQKAVIHLVDAATGRCGAVVKVPLRPGAREAIVRESDVLSVLEDDVYLSSPRLLHVNRARGISSQSFLVGSSGVRRFLPEYEDLLRSMVLLEERTTLAGHAAAWHDHPMWDYLDSQELSLMSSALAEQGNTSSLPACWVHGDFAPWNIRHRPGLCPSLIDWELAERAGLPLQDAFHFLHMQQFLFEHHPSTFHAALETFAKSIGITSFLCRKLEIAYLAQSYLSCIAWDEPRRAEFLRKSLTLAVRQRPRLVVGCDASKAPRLRLVSSRPLNRNAARVDLFTRVILELDRSGLRYCVLGGYEHDALAGTSDVDIMFRPEDLHRAPSALVRAATAAGAQLVQCIQHETSAAYFVLAKPDGKHIHHLAFDCYGDYRRDGRTWLRAEPVIAARRQLRGVWRPASADEFIYRLTKNILKQSLNAEQLKRLQHLLAEDAEGALNRIWSTATAQDICRAIVEQNLSWFREALPALYSELLRARNVRGRMKRIRDRWHEVLRLTSRVLSPTGMLISIRGEGADARQTFTDRLVCNLSQAFRRQSRVEHSNSLPARLLHNLGSRVARIRSTLVADVEQGNTGLPPNDPFGVSRIRLFAKPDLVLQIKTGEGRASCGKPRRGGRLIMLNPDLPVDQLTEQANAAVLNWMAARVARRLRLPACPSPATSGEVGGAMSENVERESVGSD